MPSSGEQAWVRFVALGAIALLAIVIGIAPVLTPRGEPVEGFNEAATAHVAEIATTPHNASRHRPPPWLTPSDPPGRRWWGRRDARRTSRG